MGIQAGVGHSYNRNPQVAGREAVEKALLSAGVERPDFVFVFATVGYDQPVLLGAVREAAGDAPLCGCSGEDIIAGGVMDESNFAVGVMAISSDQLRFRHGVVTGLRADPVKTGRAIAEAIQPELSPDTLALFLFPDGITVNFDRLVAGLEGHLNSDRLLPIVGGTAADNMEGKRTYQYHDDRLVSDGVAWVLLSGGSQLAWAVNHGCVPVGVEHKVTRCEKNVIFEIDGRPALEILRDYLKDDELEDWARVIVTFSFGLRAPGYMEDYDEYVIRGLVGGIDHGTGSVTIPTEVPEGTSIWVTRRDYEKLASGVEKLTKEIRAQLGGQPAGLILQFDCAGRGRIFLRKEEKLQLLEKLRLPIGLDVPWLGFFTYGEIAPVRGHNCFHNYTAVLTAVY